jgi:hypothetical protein
MNVCMIDDTQLALEIFDSLSRQARDYNNTTAIKELNICINSLPRAALVALRGNATAVI